MRDGLKIYKITFVGYHGVEDNVYMCAHSPEYAIQCFKDCSDDEILYVAETFLDDGFILN